MIPGLGQVYNGLIARALSQFVVFVLLVWTSAEGISGSLEAIVALLIIGFWAWQVVDAAFRDGHFLLDTAPGTTFLMVPMIARATTIHHMGWNNIGEPELRKLHQQVREGLYARFGGEVPA